ncbi:MAG: hypothetical protein MRY74_14165 [Neomegalonema sp.]|nr:hypothetical protein [Neomegalonema sp.]
MTAIGRGEPCATGRGWRSSSAAAAAVLSLVITAPFAAAQPTAADVADPVAAAKAELASVCDRIVYPADFSKFARREDLTGDGRDDVVIRYEVSCNGSKLIFCGKPNDATPDAALRCAGAVFVALPNGKYRRTSLPAELKAATLPDGRKGVLVDTATPGCGVAPNPACTAYFVWNGDDFEKATLAVAPSAAAPTAPELNTKPTPATENKPVEPDAKAEIAAAEDGPAPETPEPAPTSKPDGVDRETAPVAPAEAAIPETDARPAPAEGSPAPTNAAAPSSEPPASADAPPASTETAPAEDVKKPAPNAAAATPEPAPKAEAAAPTEAPGAPEEEDAPAAAEKSPVAVDAPAPSDTPAPSDAPTETPAPADDPVVDAGAPTEPAAPTLAPLDPKTPREPSVDRWWVETVGDRAALTAVLGKDGESTLIATCTAGESALLLTLAVSPAATKRSKLPTTAGALAAISFKIAGATGEVRLMSYDAALKAWTDRIEPNGKLAKGVRLGSKVTASEPGRTTLLFQATLRGSSKAWDALYKACGI